MIAESRPQSVAKPFANLAVYRDPKDVGLGRYILSELLKEHPLRDDAVQVASELMANAVIHPEQGPGRGSLDLRVSRVNSSLLIEVIDPGEPGGFPIPRPSMPDPTSESGRGLAIVNQLAAAWGTYATEDGKRVVWAIISPS